MLMTLYYLFLDFISQVVQASPGAELDENKENVCFPQNLIQASPEAESSAGTEVTDQPKVTEIDDQEEVRGHQPEARGQGESGRVLHPELKQILGQSHIDHAISLPLITALCNDTSLVHASRSHSGSRSSYDTSTVRSTDSHRTRLSHDTDPRRWSSCYQGSGLPDVMLSVQTGRPYSWHSEHFDLDSHPVGSPRPLALLPPPSEESHLPPTSPPNPRAAALNNPEDSASGASLCVPQKMIESDPGPSSPRDKSAAGSNSWWESHPAGSDPRSASLWVGALPNSPLARHLGKQHPGTSSLQHLQHHGKHHHHGNLQKPAQRPHKVPSRLSSGGSLHRDNEASIKQVMKENIGIA